MDINKKSSKSNSLPVVLALIIVPVLFIFGTMMIIAIVMTTTRPTIKLTLSEATNITDSSANFSVNIEGDKDKIQSKGFVYGTASNPEIKSRTNNSNPFSDLFNSYNYSEITGTYVEMSEDKNNAIADDLLPETKYYVRAYAMTGAGITYSNELSFMTKENYAEMPKRIYYESQPIGTTPESRDDKRQKDVNEILDAILKLKARNPKKIPSYPQLSPVPKNLRIGGIFENTPCTYSDIQDDEIELSNSLKDFGFNIPQDPQFKSVACTDYSITLEPNKTITVSAPNAEISVIKVNSANK
jgi:hypothetical protein